MMRNQSNLPARFVIKGLDIVVPIALIILEITLNILCMGTFINLMCLGLFVAAVTSPVWMTALVLGWPFLLCAGCVLRFSSIRLYITAKILAAS